MSMDETFPFPWTATPNINTTNYTNQCYGMKGDHCEGKKSANYTNETTTTICDSKLDLTCGMELENFNTTKGSKCVSKNTCGKIVPGSEITDGNLIDCFGFLGDHCFDNTECSEALKTKCGDIFLSEH